MSTVEYEEDFNDNYFKKLGAKFGLIYGVSDIEIPYGVCFDSNTAGKEINAISYDSNGNVTLPDISNPLFKGWYTAASGGTKVGDGGETVNWSDIILTGYKNTKLYAQYKPHTHQWNYTLNNEKIQLL